ncbi:MAG: putrescine/spermidine ABC transporter ATP-binding protein [Gammaproteobacteria bacterium RIFCSPHIGHO2_12_FULL_35_23]|nr:MAG: putrescine/spermidine ABC transporter ATP-binding protein [Gammaproteobacteria bacterium RIFCSPHIGHO2_12_FULL_35_23]
MNNVIKVRNITKVYHDTVVLESINLDVNSGEFLTLLGPSGCGKTTLLRLISGFEEPTAGSIMINGRDVKGLPPHLRDVNTVFQSYALFPHMTVYENIAFGLKCKKLPKTEIADRVQEALAMVRLEKLAGRRPAQLSGGQQQRVAIARAVVNKPLVLLLDEPLSALDYSLRKNMQIELKSLQRKLGITFILVTHDQEEALSMSDRVVIMDEGIIQQVGTPRQIYESPNSLHVAKFIGEANIFETEVLSVSENHLQLRIEGKIFTLSNKRGAKLGQSVYMLVRPEDLRAWDKSEIIDREDKDELIQATVEQVIYKGSTVDLILRTASGKRLSATEFFDEDDEDLDYKINETVWVEWMPGWEVILPYDE